MNKQEIFSKVKKAKNADKKAFLMAFCTSKSVLDVGCVGQDYAYSSPEWLHNQIKNRCSYIDGVDIDKLGVKALQESGYSVYTPDQLAALNKKYDIVLLSDVIEHVNNPVEFIEFYSAFLNEKGVMVISTPNAHGIRNFSSIILRNDYSVNFEHTFWFCPKTITEVAARANLRFVDFYWLKEYRTFKDTKGLLYKLIYLFNSIMQKMRSGFHPNFLFILSK